MELKEINETASKKDVEEICLWLTQTEGVVGANRIAEKIRNFYSEAEQEFGPGKDKTVVAQAMLNLSRRRRNAVKNILACITGIAVLCLLVFIELTIHPHSPLLEKVYGKDGYWILASLLFGGVLSVLLLLLIGAVGGLLGGQRRSKADAMLVKFYARSAKLSDENEKLKIELQQLREGDR